MKSIPIAQACCFQVLYCILQSPEILYKALMSGVLLCWAHHAVTVTAEPGQGPCQGSE